MLRNNYGEAQEYGLDQLTRGVRYDYGVRFSYGETDIQPAATGYILLESGDFLLLESGDKFLLETSVVMGMGMGGSLKAEPWWQFWTPKRAPEPTPEPMEVPEPDPVVPEPILIPEPVEIPEPILIPEPVVPWWRRAWNWVTRQVKRLVGR